MVHIDAGAAGAGFGGWLRLMANQLILTQYIRPMTLIQTNAEPRWYTLMRRAAGEEVGGRLRLAFEWDITARGLLALKLAALERVLAQRTEILCALHPVPPARAAAWSASPGRRGLPASGHPAAAAGGSSGDTGEGQGGGGGGVGAARLIVSHVRIVRRCQALSQCRPVAQSGTCLYIHLQTLACLSYGSLLICSGAAGEAGQHQ